MYSQCDSDHAGDLLVSCSRERELGRLVAVTAAGGCLTVLLMLSSRREERDLAMPGCGEQEMLAVACGRCRGRPVASCDQ